MTSFEWKTFSNPFGFIPNLSLIAPDYLWKGFLPYSFLIFIILNIVSVFVVFKFERNLYFICFNHYYFLRNSLVLLFHTLHGDILVRRAILLPSFQLLRKKRSSMDRLDDTECLHRGWVYHRSDILHCKFFTHQLNTKTPIFRPVTLFSS